MAVGTRHITKVDRAALAFSLLSTRTAEVVHQHLTITERRLLREGLSRTSGASDEDRMSAIRALASEVRKGMEWPRLSSHDAADCPFTPISLRPRFQVVEVIERVAKRDPMQAVVTLCHLEPEVRDELWSRISVETRSVIAPKLDGVHLVSQVRTREYARDMSTRLARAARDSGRTRLAG